VVCKHLLAQAQKLSQRDIVVVGTIRPYLSRVTIKNALKIIRKHAPIWRFLNECIKSYCFESTNLDPFQYIVKKISDLPDFAIYSLAFIGPVKVKSSCEEPFSLFTSIEFNLELANFCRDRFSKLISDLEKRRPEVGCKMERDCRFMASWNPLF
jgi:hypothetical protein